MTRDDAKWLEGLARAMRYVQVVSELELYYNSTGHDNTPFSRVLFANAADGTSIPSRLQRIALSERTE